ncbi:hypothetical protein P153DRAFT_368677 [Dothidotthia symphoricarpi CBS 119687]|uniref:C2H2-type domain-containing protein n=1 Tax=Dothidotthia symphoricarpi CBS 119687 TaxID=1392245 RepID=A0A6A6A9M6_9PLEO|nr:uncharacterized protein P153DRAFT_368677 [Dothidotthia symphoricarpi CBS 119687]KAF2127371.1 hypothetical protein P153DRAFT_368677 [Dothidotthia symphoricarpi CBS 119687]
MMNGYEHYSAGTQFLHDVTMGGGPESNTNIPTHLSAQQTQSSPQGLPWTYQQKILEYPAHPVQLPRHQPSTSIKPQPLLHRPHLPASTPSSVSSVWRWSGETLFSKWADKGSTAPSASTWSNHLEYPSDHHILGAGYPTDFVSSPPPSHTSDPVEGLMSPLSPSKNRTTHRRATKEKSKDPYATCVSKSQRSRRSSKPPKYFCTACAEPFVEKFDWKRHEKTYQERTEMFKCDLCNAIYFLEKDFVHHHVKCHRCQMCFEKGHVQSSKKLRRKRTAWGCGFCVHLSTSWKDRCEHVAQHFETKGVDMSKWLHSYVIYSLLQQPPILREWNKILEKKRHFNPTFGWNQHSTGRVEGYPESNPTPHLQDLLEYYTPNQDAAALACLAYKKAVKRKELPKSPGAPPVPPKDYGSIRAPPLQDAMKDRFSRSNWNLIESTIQEDPELPTDVCMLDYDLMNEAFHHEFDTFYS